MAKQQRFTIGLPSGGARDELGEESPYRIDLPDLVEERDRAKPDTKQPKAKPQPVPANPLYSGLGDIDRKAQEAIKEYLATAGAGGGDLPNNLEKLLTARYSPWSFPTAPAYKETKFAGGYAPAAYGSTTFSEAKSVADLPENIREAMFQRGAQRIGREKTGQIEDVIDRLTRSGRGEGLKYAALRDINRAAMEQTGSLAEEQNISEAGRRYQEAQNVRGLNLQRELNQAAENLKAAGFSEDQARYLADQRLQEQQLQAGEEKYKTGLEDITETRRAAENEKQFLYQKAGEQDRINTIMGQAQFQEGKRQAGASREQAAINEALNYLGQGGSYRLGQAQLGKEGQRDIFNIGSQVGQAAGTGVGFSTLTQQPVQAYQTYQPYQPQNVSTYRRPTYA